MTSTVTGELGLDGDVVVDSSVDADIDRWTERAGISSSAPEPGPP